MKSNLGPRLKKSALYIIFTAVMYISLPVIAMSMNRADIYNLTPILDCCCALAIGYFYGRKAKRDPIMPLASGVLFIPCLFVFYNPTAWIYIPIAALCSFIGECFGSLYQGKFGK